MPELFRVSRVLADRPENKTRFLILGSASPDLIKNVSETLAGRIEFVELSGFDIHETGANRSDALWLRGGFPCFFLLLLPMKTVWRGATTLFRPSWPEIFHSLASRFRLRPCVVSGRCSPITTVRPGMPRSSAVPSTSRTKRCAPISTFSWEPLWSGNFNRGTKTSASARSKHLRFICGIRVFFTLCLTFRIFTPFTAMPGWGHRGKACYRTNFADG